MQSIRLAPSGPVIGNTDGGPLRFGSGAVLRRALLVFAITGTNSDPLTGADYVLGTEPATPQTAPVIATLTECDPNLYYDLRAEFDATNEDAGNGAIQVLLQTSIDNLNWTTRWTTLHTMGADTGAAGGTFTARRIVAQFPPMLGSVLGITTAASQLFARVVVSAPTGSALRVQSSNDGMNIVQLTETF